MTTDATTSTVIAALMRVTGDELIELARLAENANDSGTPSADLPRLLRQPDRALSFKAVATFITQRCREAADRQDPARVRTARLALAALDAAVGRRMQEIGSVPLGQAAAAPAAARDLKPDLTDGAFILQAFENELNRGCSPRELRHWQMRLERAECSRSELIAQLQAQAVRQTAAEHAAEAAHDGLSLHVMGTGQRVTLNDWRARAEQLKTAAPGPARAPDADAARFHIIGKPRRLVTAIASLYKGGRHIARFLQNITSQTCFADYAELIIIDADSPDGEADVIAPYLQRFRNIRYLRSERRIGIYEAWNLAVAQASGDYLTCTNVDDLRRQDSLELQAAALDNLPFADVVYQDFYYSFDPELDFDSVARFGIRSRLPLVTPYTLMSCNPPHNAPMWRRRLHDEIGLFDTRYQSAGDYDFWMRCMAAGKTFFKLNDPHVVYYQNPEGLSTRPGTRGFAETKAVHRSHDGKLISPNLLMPFGDFCASQTPGLPPQLDDGRQDRARQVQRALRQLARSAKFLSADAGAAA